AHPYRALELYQVTVFRKLHGSPSPLLGKMSKKTRKAGTGPAAITLPEMPRAANAAPCEVCPRAGSGHRSRGAPLRFGALGYGAKLQAACVAKAGSFLSSQFSGVDRNAMPMCRTLPAILAF